MKIDRRDFLWVSSLVTMGVLADRVFMPVVSNCPPCPCAAKPLDGYPDLVRAYSFRQLLSGAELSAGFRRTSDNQERSFGFVDGWIDYASLYAWAGSDLLQGWFYDQAGSGEILFDPVADSQAWYDGSRPGFITDGIDDRFSAEVEPFGGSGQNTTAIVFTPFAGNYPFQITNSGRAREIAPFIQNASKISYYKRNTLLFKQPPFSGWSYPAYWLAVMDENINTLRVNGEHFDTDDKVLSLPELTRLQLGWRETTGDPQHAMMSISEWVIINGVWGSEQWEPYDASVSQDWGGF